MNARNCQESLVSEKEHLNLTKFGQLCCKDPCLGSLRKINLLLTTRDLRAAIAPNRPSGRGSQKVNSTRITLLSSFSYIQLRLPCHPPQARRWAPVATHPASRRGNELSGAHLAWNSTINSEEIRHGILLLATSVGRYVWSRAPWLEGPGGLGPHGSTEPPPHSLGFAPLPTQMGHQAAQCTVGTINWREMYGDDAFKIRPTVFQSDIDAVAKARKIDFAQLEEAARGWAQVRGLRRMPVAWVDARTL